MTLAVGYADAMSDTSAVRPDLHVTRVPEASRFELRLGDERVGLADYARRGEIVTVTHVETDPAHQGRGFAGALMDGVVESVRANGERIVPLCPYAAHYMEQHPDAQDLLAGGPNGSGPR